MSNRITYPLFFLSFPTSKRLGGKHEKEQRMPKMVATGTRIGIGPSLFSSGCLWFVSWHPHCSVEWCYNILTISRSRNVNSPLGYLYKITNCISCGEWNKDQQIIKFIVDQLPMLFPSFSFGSTLTFIYLFFSCPAASASSFFFEMWKELLELWHKL